MRSSRRASIRVRTRNGVPPVASQQAAANSGSGSTPKPAATSVATPLGVSGPTVTTSVAGSIVRAASNSRLAPASAGRAPSSTAACSSSRRGNRKARKRSDAASAQWASSTTSARGRPVARLAHSPERKLPFQLGAACSQHPETIALCGIPAGRQQDRLADPSRPFDDQRTSVALLRPVQTPPDPLQLSITLEQETIALTLGRGHNPNPTSRLIGPPEGPTPASGPGIHLDADAVRRLSSEGGRPK